MIFWKKKHSYSVHMILFLSTQIGLRYTHYNIDQINIECLSDYFTVLLIIILQLCYLLHLFLLVIITFYKYVECLPQIEKLIKIFLVMVLMIFKVQKLFKKLTTDGNTNAYIIHSTLISFFTYIKSCKIYVPVLVWAYNYRRCNNALLNRWYRSYRVIVWRAIKQVS